MRQTATTSRNNALLQYGVGAAANFRATEPEGRTVGLVCDLVEQLRPDVVVYLGGDGTFNEVARAV